MRLAAATHNDSRLSFSTLSAFTQPNRESHQSAWHAPVQKVVERVDVDQHAVGQRGSAVPLQTFVEQLLGVGRDGSRAHALQQSCAP
jgi:hypothetical protein